MHNGKWEMCDEKKEKEKWKKLAALITNLDGDLDRFVSDMEWQHYMLFRERGRAIRC
jgi:hypothetical protein